MSKLDKNQAVIDFLLTCPEVKNNKLFFNFGQVEDCALQVTASNELVLARYINGSTLKRLSIIIDNFRSVAYNPVISQYQDENLSELNEVQTLVDWINEQGENYIFPVFDDDCVIEEMHTKSPIPEISGVNTQTTPNTAVYSITIEILYTDNSKRVF